MEIIAPLPIKKLDFEKINLSFLHWWRFNICFLKYVQSVVTIDFTSSPGLLSLGHGPRVCQGRPDGDGEADGQRPRHLRFRARDRKARTAKGFKESGQTFRRPRSERD